MAVVGKGVGPPSGLQLRAYHEAGHAVAALLKGLSLTRVTISRRGRSGGARAGRRERRVAARTLETEYSTQKSNLSSIPQRVSSEGGRSSGPPTRSAIRALMSELEPSFGDTMHARVDGERFDAVFSITGAFDPIAASQLRARLAGLPPDTCVVLDFSRAWEVADLALAVLAAALATTRHPRVLLRGLTQHQERMLRYLGVDHLILGAPSRDDRPEWVGEA